MSKYSAIFDNEEDALLCEQADEALLNDDEETFYELMKKVPLDPHVASAVKDVMGIDYLLNGEFNLSKAVKKYGQEWLEK